MRVSAVLVHGRQLTVGARLKVCTLRGVRKTSRPTTYPPGAMSSRAHPVSDGAASSPSPSNSSSAASSSSLLEPSSSTSAQQAAEREAALFARFKQVFSRTTLPSQDRDPRKRWSSDHLPTLNQLRSDGVNGEIQVHDGKLRSLYWKVIGACNAALFLITVLTEIVIRSFTLHTYPS